MKDTKIGHGIDLAAPGGIEKLLAFHRGIYGHATMSVPAGEPAAPPGEQAPAGDPAGTPPAGEQTPAAGEQTPAAGEQTPAEPQTIDGLPDWAQRELREARTEAGRYRTEAKAAGENAQSELVSKLAQALGLAPGAAGEQAPTVESLTEQVQSTSTELEAARAESRANAVDFAAWKRSGHHNVDPAALLDSRTFQAKTRDLDPADEGFQDKLDEAIKAALSENSRLLASQAGGSSSSDHPGGSGEGQNRGPVTLEQASARAWAAQTT